ncbi:hypothetical protein J8273_5064 [Carpediemonas membranifera]|uniref:Uncharacterized protein n=1 Tax=Carpediemonas membranifera TaxID=201153 RepID=A0A8J6E3S8_9EUKA|nr:hypothetical protein J8273_5064 [Carpediemonas membranifera]|eukprot:KAG9393577.1 hypothetical protein J8273_5064 [Carpediemonas membranifera]
MPIGYGELESRRDHERKPGKRNLQVRFDALVEQEREVLVALASLDIDIGSHAHKLKRTKSVVRDRERSTFSEPILTRRQQPEQTSARPPRSIVSADALGRTPRLPLIPYPRKENPALGRPPMPKKQTPLKPRLNSSIKPKMHTVEPVASFPAMQHKTMRPVPDSWREIIAWTGTMGSGLAPDQPFANVVQRLANGFSVARVLLMVVSGTDLVDDASVFMDGAVARRSNWTALSAVFDKLSFQLSERELKMLQSVEPSDDPEDPLVKLLGEILEAIKGLGE